MRLVDDHNNYGLVSVINHWLVAAFVLTQLTIGIYMDELPEDAQKYWIGLHIAIGGTAFLFIAFRVLWRIIMQSPALTPQDRRLQILARAVHHLLLLGISIMIISGPLMVWSAGYPVNIFDLVVIPSPTGKIETLHEILEEVHEITAWSIVALLVLHILGTLKHTFIDRDGTLARMLGRSADRA